MLPISFTELTVFCGLVTQYRLWIYIYIYMWLSLKLVIRDAVFIGITIICSSEVA